MPIVKNLTKEDLPTRADDGSTITLAPSETKEMSGEYANKMIQVHGTDRVIIVEESTAPALKQVFERKVKTKKK